MFEAQRTTFKFEGHTIKFDRVGKNRYKVLTPYSLSEKTGPETAALLDELSKEARLALLELTGCKEKLKEAALYDNAPLKKPEPSDTPSAAPPALPDPMPEPIPIRREPRRARKAEAPTIVPKKERRGVHGALKYARSIIAEAERQEALAKAR